MTAIASPIVLQPKQIQLLAKLDPLLAQYNLANHKAKVVLVLDGSGSMHDLIRDGGVQELVDRTMPLGIRFDDNMAIDVFIFSNRAVYVGEVSPRDLDGFIKRNIDKFPMNTTKYSTAISAVRQHFFGSAGPRRSPLKAPDGMPVYVLFVTDGVNDRDDHDRCVEQLTSASYEPIFWQFVALGADYMPGKAAPAPKKSGFFSSWFGGVAAAVGSCPSDFAFLNELDQQVPNRYIDNAGFFAIRSPSSISEEEMLARMFVEYPEWVHERAPKGGLL